MPSTRDVIVCDSPGCRNPAAATVRAPREIYGFCAEHVDINRSLSPVKFTKEGRPELDGNGRVVFAPASSFQPGSTAPLRVLDGAAEAERLRRALEDLGG